MSSMRGEFDLILAAIIAFSKSVPVRSTYQNRWVLDSVLSQLINELIDAFDITTPKMNKALCDKEFKAILGDDSAFNNLLIYRRKFSKKCYYFFSTNKEDPPPSNKDWAWAVSPPCSTELDDDFVCSNPTNID
jgi:hypothetical protein